MSLQRLCLRGTTAYWVNALDGQPTEESFTAHTLRPDVERGELKVELHGLANPVHDAAVAALCIELNASRYRTPQWAGALMSSNAGSLIFVADNPIGCISMAAWRWKFSQGFARGKQQASWSSLQLRGPDDRRRPSCYRPKSNRTKCRFLAALLS